MGHHRIRSDLVLKTVSEDTMARNRYSNSQFKGLPSPISQTADPTTCRTHTRFVPTAKLFSDDLDGALDVLESNGGIRGHTSPMPTDSLPRKTMEALRSISMPSGIGPNQDETSLSSRFSDVDASASCRRMYPFRSVRKLQSLLDWFVRLNNHFGAVPGASSLATNFSATSHGAVSGNTSSTCTFGHPMRTIQTALMPLHFRVRFIAATNQSPTSSSKGETIRSRFNPRVPAC